MKKLTLLTLIAALGLGSAYAKTDATRKSELDALFGAKPWRIVFESDVEGSPNLLKVDSTGKISSFLKTPGSGLHLPNFTIDGTRVVYINEGTGSICIADWATGTAKTVISGGYTAGDGDAVSSFRNSAGKDMILCKPGNSSTIYLVDADDPTNKQTVYSGNLSPSYISVSGDGKYIAADWNGYNTVGVFEIGKSTSPTYWPCTGMAVKSPNVCGGGCWLNIARDNSYNILYTVEPHRGCLKINGTTKLLDVSFPFIQSGTEYNGLRWSNDQDFCSVYDDENQGANPYIVKLSTMTYVTLQDGLTSLYGHVGMHIGPTTPVASQRSTSPSARLAGMRGSSSRTVDIFGRTLSASQATRPGVYFKVMNGSAAAQKSTIARVMQ